jgi:hypothetical protein
MSRTRLNVGVGVKNSANTMAHKIPHNAILVSVCGLVDDLQGKALRHVSQLQHIDPS